MTTTLEMTTNNNQFTGPKQILKSPPSGQGGDLTIITLTCAMNYLVIAYLAKRLAEYGQRCGGKWFEMRL